MVQFDDGYAFDTTSGTISIRGNFDNDEQRLWPGEFVTDNRKAPVPAV